MTLNDDKTTENIRFTYFLSFHKAIQRVTDPVNRCKLYDALCNYGILGTIPQGLDVYGEMFFDMVKPVVDRSKNMRREGNQNAKKTQIERKRNANETQTNRVAIQGIGKGDGIGDGIGIECRTLDAQEVRRRRLEGR